MPLESNSQLDFLEGYPPADDLEDMGKGLGGEQGEYYLKLAEERRESDRLAWSIILGVTAMFSSIFYFATWGIVKKILHKKYPKLIGITVVSIYLISVLYLALSSMYPFEFI